MPKVKETAPQKEGREERLMRERLQESRKLEREYEASLDPRQVMGV